MKNIYDYLKQIISSTQLGMLILTNITVFLGRIYRFSIVIQLSCLKKGRGMCYSVGRMVHIKEPYCYSEKSSPCNGGCRLPLLPSGPLQHIRRHITVNKMY